MERIPNAVYTREFREEAVRLVREGGLTVPEVARRLLVPKSTISYWARADKQGTLALNFVHKFSMKESLSERYTINFFVKGLVNICRKDWVVSGQGNSS